MNYVVIEKYLRASLDKKTKKKAKIHQEKEDN